jgi:hypothetical protein
VALMAEAVEDSTGRRRQRRGMTTGADKDCGGGQQRQARPSGRLQRGRNNGGKQCQRQRSGNDGFDGRRRQWQTTMGIANNNSGGRRQRRMMTTCKIGRLTMTGKDESGRQEMAETVEW